MARKVIAMRSAHSRRRWLVAVFMAALATVAGCATPAPKPTAVTRPLSGPSCRVVHIPVLIPQVTTPSQITGDICEPVRPSATMLLLVAGGGENADYWNMPGLARNSLVDAATAAGFATLAIDRIGTGRSTFPPSSKLVTYAAEVSTVHQVATALRTDSSLFGRTWGTIVGIGHSLGSGTVLGVAANHPDDVNALILTGYGSTVTPQTLQLGKIYQVPAHTMSAAWSGLDDGYVTVIPSAVEKIGLLYGSGTSKAELAAASAHQGTLSESELSTRPQGAAASAQAAQITMPVLIANGQYDRHYCEGNAIDQPVSFTPQCESSSAFGAYAKALLPNACVATSLVPNSGHAIQEENAAPEANTSYLTWINLTLGGGHAHCTVQGPISGSGTP